MKQQLTNNEKWIEKDWLNIDFGDKRLNKRAKSIASDLLRNPFDTPPKMLKQSKKIKAFYRTLNSNKVTHDKIILEHTQNTKKKMINQKTVLNIQDSTTISLNRNYNIEGLYLIGNVQGLVVHNTISVIPEKDYGTIDGLLNQIILKRKLKKEREKKDNEIRLWLDSITTIGKPAKNTVIIDVCDRGADSLRVMHCSKQNGHEFVIRAQYNRVINEKQEYLLAFARSLKTSDYITLKIQGTQVRKKRTAKLRIAFSKVTLEPSRKKLEPIQVTIIHVLETDPLKGQKPLEWFLLTSLPTDNIEQAKTIIQYYTYRWTIEEYHKCMKTGFRLEETQLKTLERIKNLIGFISITAVKLLQMRDIAKKSSQENALKHVQQEDINIIKGYYKIKKEKMTLNEFLRYIAQLGGFMNRKSDGNPGWQSIWSGWKFFLTLKEGFTIHKETSYG